MPREHVLTFSVDSALLRELGERLVGKAHIALAELVKNSYDADATEVVLHFGNDRIVITDNGHGMTFDEFKRFWMRIGTPHKQKKGLSRKLKRPMTGSKGVGRLSAQFLASTLSLTTVSDRNQEVQLSVGVDWKKAQQAGELTKAEAECTESAREITFPAGARHGTQIVLTELNEPWDSEKIRSLAREVWALQSPFSESLPKEDPRRFRVRIEGTDDNLVEPAQRQLRAYLDIWDARLIGKLPPYEEGSAVKTPATIVVEFSDGKRVERSYSILKEEQGEREEGKWDSTRRSLDSAEFEIRIYKLEGKQRFGIQVGDAREFFNKYGGVHIYDAGFRLPFYGVETDWLRIERDHSHRLSKSQLLPDQFHVSHGLNNLPTNTRIFGVVNVNTSREREIAEVRAQGEVSPDYLMISVTRDRLVENTAYFNLRVLVRWALDFYAMEATKRKIEELETERPVEPAREKIYRIETVLDDYRDQVPQPLLQRIKSEVRDAQIAEEKERKFREGQSGLLGSLASAGMAALAVEHEFYKQDSELDGIISDMKRALSTRMPSVEKLRGIQGRLEVWRSRVNATRQLFAPLLDEDSRTERHRLRAKPIVEDIVGRTEVFLRGIPVNTDQIDPEIRLPPATLAEWTAIFQNVLVNAVNAMLDSTMKRIRISSSKNGNERAIVVEDTGVGVDLATSENLFKPFVRRSKVSKERDRLRLGGTGLGLTIVRMIAENLDCSVGFVGPEYRFKTAFKLAWRER